MIGATLLEAGDMTDEAAAPGRSALGRIADPLLPVAGLAGLGIVWWLGGWLIGRDPALAAFTGFAPAPTLTAFVRLVTDPATVWTVLTSLGRVAGGLAAAFCLGVPLGLLMGSLPRLERALHLPVQILRMVSPLSWMPVAVIAFSTFDGAIIFLIGFAAFWPILLSTALGVRRIDPAWLSVSRTLGGRGFALIRHVLAPAVLPDVLASLRLALGVGWIVLVPAEYLGVTSGLGYAINDARDTLSYDRLAALVLLIGLIGFFLDSLIGALQRRASWHTAL